MKKLSQRTLVQVMRALETVPDRECFRFLYERELPDWFVIHAQSFYDFGWERILIDLRNTQFFYPSHSYGGNILGVQYLSEPEAEELGEVVNQKLAAIAASLPDGAAVENSLQLDGYAVDKRKLELVALEGPVSAQAEEDALDALLRRSGIPNAATVHLHMSDANGLFVDGKFHPSLNESRNVLQAIIDDISAETDRNGGHATRLPGGTVNRIRYLADVGFLTADEQLAFDSAWKALSAGSHPGVPVREVARIGLMLALEFGQLLLLKCEDWRSNAYRRFSRP